MPSPFPGMDPYLEGGWWSTFHLHFLVEMRRQLTDLVHPDHFALIGSYRVLTMDSPLRFLPKPELVRERAPSGTPPVYLNLALPHPVGISYVKIQDSETRKIRAIVHLLDPVIKKNPGRRHYLRWRAKVLAKRVSLIEIDLLRQGRRPPMLGSYPDAPYCIMINEPELRPICEVWPVQFQQPLPTIRVQLARDRVVKLDLQGVFVKTYDEGSLGRMLDYSDKPDVPLTAEENEWARRLLSASDHPTPAKQR